MHRWKWGGWKGWLISNEDAGRGEIKEGALLHHTGCNGSSNISKAESNARVRRVSPGSGGGGLSMLSGQLVNAGDYMRSSGYDADRQRYAELLLVKATDYPTPPEILEDPSKIPSYYVFQSNMVTDEDLQPGMLRNLEVDRRLTLPTRTHIRFLITGGDVIHSWAVPSLGIKADAIPGRLNKINCFIMREGVYYGQCSELCGALHGFMPIVVEAVSPETYAAHARKFYKD